MPGTKPTPTKLSPTAYDRWWRSRINKEEGAYGISDKQVHSTRMSLDTLGSPRQEIVVPGDHLMGAGAMVRTLPAPLQEPQGLDAAIANVSARMQADNASVAKSRASGVSRRSGHTNGHQHRYEGVSGSQASYPKTQSGVSGTDSTIVRRLVNLEQELARERIRREHAEHEMRQMMAAAQLATAK